MDKFNWIKSYLLNIIFNQHISSENSINIVFDEKKFSVCVLDYLKANPDYLIEFANMNIAYIDTKKDDENKTTEYYLIERKLEEED